MQPRKTGKRLRHVVNAERARRGAEYAAQLRHVFKNDEPLLARAVIVPIREIAFRCRQVHPVRKFLVESGFIDTHRAASRTTRQLGFQTKLPRDSGLDAPLLAFHLDTPLGRVTASSRARWRS